MVIRTLGNAGDKYLALLNSIQRQTLQPAEVVVVIPEGYPLDHRIGNERVIRSAKGMVTQRAMGICSANSEWLLVVDDDVQLPDDFAEKVLGYAALRQLDCVLCSPHEQNSIADEGRKKPFTTARRMRLAFTAQAFYSTRKSAFFDTITTSGGHRTYVNHPNGLCQTGPFFCFMVKADKARGVHFEEDAWLEQGTLTSYAAYDDACFFYKLYLAGARIAYCHSVRCLHLDAAAGRPAESAMQARCRRLYSIARNRTLFWRKYIFGRRRTLRNLLGGLHGIFGYALYNTLINLHRPAAIRAMFLGYKEALLPLK